MERIVNMENNVIMKMKAHIFLILNFSIIAGYPSMVTIREYASSG